LAVSNAHTATASSTATSTAVIDQYNDDDT
jgi:hypothetical protein